MLGAVCNHFYLTVLQTEFFDDIGDDLFRCNVRIEKYFRLPLIFNFHPTTRIIVIRLAVSKFGRDILFPRLFVVIIIAVFGVERRYMRERTGYAYGINGNAEQIRKYLLESEQSRSISSLECLAVIWRLASTPSMSIRSSESSNVRSAR